MNLFPLNPHICPPPAILGSSYRFREKSSSVSSHNIKNRIPNLILEDTSPLTRKSELCVAAPAPSSSAMATIPATILATSKTPTKKRVRQNQAMDDEVIQETSSLFVDSAMKIERKNKAQLKKLHSIKVHGLSELMAKELSALETSVVEIFAKKSFYMEKPIDSSDIVHKEASISPTGDRASPASVCNDMRMHDHPNTLKIFTPREKWAEILEDLKTPKGQTLQEYADKVGMPTRTLTDGLRKRGLPITKLYKNKILTYVRASDRETLSVEQRHRITKLRAEGMPHHEIAKLLGIVRTYTVANYLSNFSLKKATDHQ